MSISRLLSLFVVGLYLLIAHLWADSVKNVSPAFAGIALFGLVCVWFGDELGGYIGNLTWFPISSRTPGGLIKFLGWLFLLLLPPFLFILQKHIIKTG